MAETLPPPPRRFPVQPVETTVKKSRRFPVEPVETTVRSSRKDGSLENNDNTSENGIAAKRRFVPEPVETTFRSIKPHPAIPVPPQRITPDSIPPSSPPAEPRRPSRRFTPQLIETSKRSKRAGDTAPATLITDKVDITPGTNHIYVERKRRLPHPPADTIPLESSSTSSSVNIHATHITPLPPRRQPSMRPHPNTRRSTRQDSFQPELEPIISENSNEDSDGEERNEGDSTPSLSGSIGSSDDSMRRLQLARTRESCDDRFSGYLLALATKAAETQLRDQAMAAFPNETFHELVEHFYDREVDAASDDGSVEGIGMLVDDRQIQELRRKSTEVGWAAREMQQHQEKLNRLREEETNKKIAAEATQPTFKDPFWTNGMTEKSNAFARIQGAPNDEEQGEELDRMRSAASPPMLGSDLKFRMCPSPKATKFETDQRPDVQPNRADNGGGLWSGYCVSDEAGKCVSPSAIGLPLLQTPHPEREVPFSSASSSEIPVGARSPKPNENAKGLHILAGIDDRLQSEVARVKMEEALLEEFDDSFVTQVYNYLSLGYPSLARHYDEELAKISRIPEIELRVDDHKKNAKGYIGLVDGQPPGGETKKGVLANEPQKHGARWKALQLYIMEWARQHPSMSNGATISSAWGVRARRGSWAI